MLKVLIVDDDINVVNCLSSLVPWDNIGCELVATAFNGRDGYNMTILHQPDIIICDIVMPMMDGATLCRKVFEELSDVTFIFLSAFEDFATAQLALQYHVQDYILKPINRKKLDHIIDCLRNISNLREKDSFYRRILHDREMEQLIISALANGDTDYFEMLFEQLKADATGLKLPTDRVRDLAYRMNELLNRHLRQVRRENDQEHRAIQAALVSCRHKGELIDLVSSRYFQHLSIYSPSRFAYYQTLLSEVTNYINERFTDAAFSSTSVAIKFGYSNAYLSEIYKKQYGKSISEYIVQKRLELACDLLLNTAFPLNDIAAKVGYLDRSYFSRTFKKHYGISPGDYRLTRSSHQTDPDHKKEK